MCRKGSFRDDQRLLKIKFKVVVGCVEGRNHFSKQKLPREFHSSDASLNVKNQVVVSLFRL